MTTAPIEILGAIGSEPIAESTLRTLLTEAWPATNRHGEAFTGRPHTRLLVTPSHIIKLRSEYALPVGDARRFIQQMLTRERELAVHHPDKSWFLLFSEGEETPIIANVTPRLRPLHDNALLAELPPGQYCDQICAMFDVYLRVAAERDLGLDISLSNFGIDAEQRLYYLDDDIYGFDQFTSLSCFAATLVRQVATIDAERARCLGSCLRAALLRWFDDPLWVGVVAEAAASQFVAESRRPVLEALRAGLAHAAPAPVHSHSRRIALLADIHANAAALRRVLAFLDEQGIDEGVVLGDVVGYGPEPAECIALLQARPGFKVLRGNHDHAVAGGHFALGFSEAGRWAAEWTRERLSEAELAWLGELPLYLNGDGWLAVHGSPTDKTFLNAYVYQMTAEENLAHLAERGIPWCFHGHTHLARVWYQGRLGEQSSVAPEQALGEYSQALICPGSVGQPRSGKPGAELALLDLETKQLSLLRLDYDPSPVQEKMRQWGFPTTLIERLDSAR